METDDCVQCTHTQTHTHKHTQRGVLQVIGGNYATNKLTKLENRSQLTSQRFYCYCSLVVDVMHFIGGIYCYSSCQQLLPPVVVASGCNNWRHASLNDNINHCEEDDDDDDVVERV